jgi:hypothetical protein
MENRIEIDGQWYRLVPEKELVVMKEEYDVTFSYQCETPCGTFTFNILLDDDGKMWEDTQSVTYKPKGRDAEYWDNSTWLKGLKTGEDPENLLSMLTTKESNMFLHLLKQVEEKGWL